MANKQADNEASSQQQVGEQGMLMEIGPEGMEKIRPHVQACRRAQLARKRAWQEVIEAKECIRILVHEQNLTETPNGKIVFECEGVQIEVTRRDDKVELKEKKED